MRAAAPTIARIATPMAQIETPQFKPQAGAHGAQGSQGGSQGMG